MPSDHGSREAKRESARKLLCLDGREAFGEKPYGLLRRGFVSQEDIVALTIDTETVFASGLGLSASYSAHAQNG